ncbi:NAD(P)/FAD-dependent oxidoreductase [Thermodesulfobacteriota bacterium]
MVVGDAAGLVNPVTGGGIAHALLSGEVAGRTAALAIKSGRTDRRALRAYPRRLYSTSRYLWLLAMTQWRRRLDRLSPAEQAVAYGKMLRRYFTFFHHITPIVDTLLG